MSGGGNPGQAILNHAGSSLTAGAWSPGGGGWAQGGDLSSVLANQTFGATKKLTDGVNVPDATNKAAWTLSSPDGHLRNDLQLGSNMPGAFNQSQDVLNNLQARSTTAGPTQQAQYLQDANNRSLGNNLQASDANTNSAVANATSNLAMRGGADAGARERLDRGANFQNMQDQSRLRNDAAGANTNILAQDEGQKLQTMQGLSPQLLNQAGFQQNGKQFDINNTLNTIGGKYNTDMGAWAANQSAREQAQLANKNKGLLGLGIAGL
jgi:hypothetical protein